MHETNFTLGPIKKHFYLLLLYKLLQWHWGMGPSVKHVLGVQEWSYVVPPQKPFLSFKNRVWFGLTPPPWFGESPDFLLDLSCETFPYQNQKQFLADFKIRVPIRPNYFFDFPIVRSTIKIDLNLSVTYQNLLGEP